MSHHSTAMFEYYLWSNYGERVALGRAIWAFVSASTWSDALRILQTHSHVLVTPQSIGVLSELIHDLRASQESESAEQANHWEVHLMLIEDAMRYGVDLVVCAVHEHLYH